MPISRTETPAFDPDVPRRDGRRGVRHHVGTTGERRTARTPLVGAA
jgi:hypothetical protein